MSRNRRVYQHFTHKLTFLVKLQQMPRAVKSSKMSDTAGEPCNAVMSFHLLVENADERLMLDNEY